jgi:hypothetical protein
MAMSTSGKFAHDDLVRVIKTDQTGTVKGVREANHAYVYQVQLGETESTEIDVPEEGLELVKKANDNETGFHIRYIS